MKAVFVSEEQAFWDDTIDRIKEDIKNQEKALKFQKAVLKMCRDKSSEEKRKKYKYETG